VRDIEVRRNSGLSGKARFTLHALHAPLVRCACPFIEATHIEHYRNSTPPSTGSCPQEQRTIPQLEKMGFSPVTEVTTNLMSAASFHPWGTMPLLMSIPAMMPLLMSIPAISESAALLMNLPAVSKKNLRLYL